MRALRLFIISLSVLRGMLPLGSIAAEQILPSIANPVRYRCLEALQRWNDLLDHPERITMRDLTDDEVYSRAALSLMDPLTQSLDETKGLSELAAGWNIKVEPISQSRTGWMKITAIHPKTGRTKSIQIPWSHEWDLKEKYFDQIEFGQRFNLTPENPPTSKKAEFYDLADSVFAYAIYQKTPTEIDAVLASSLQGSVYALNRLKRLSSIMRGETPLSRITDLLAGWDPLRWEEIFPRLSPPPPPDLFRVINNGLGSQIMRIDLRGTPQELGFDQAFSAFLSGTYYMDRQMAYGSLWGQTYAHSLTVLRDGQADFNFHYLKMKEYQERNPWVPEQWLNAPSDIRAFWFKEYRHSLNLTPDQLERLRAISEMVADRTEFIFMTREPAAEMISKEKLLWDFGESKWVPRTVTQFKNFEHFDILGAMSIVYSSSTTEKLPLEIFTGYSVERPPKGMVAELGRFTVKKDARPFGPKQIWKAAALIAGKEGVGKIVAETTRQYAEELMARGFRKVHERLNFEGKSEYIIEITPEEFFAYSAP